MKKRKKEKVKKMENKYFKNLTQAERKILANKGTEAPFSGEYNNHFEKGYFVCRACNNKLYESKTKFDSGCGWPAFHSEDSDACISRIVDVTHGMVRTEVRCGTCDAHLGHVFKDGPRKHGGERYCINSAAMEFEVKE